MTERERERETDRQTDRDRETQRQTKRQRDRETHTDRQTDRHAGTQEGWKVESLNNIECTHASCRQQIQGNPPSGRRNKMSVHVLCLQVVPEGN